MIYPMKIWFIGSEIVKEEKEHFQKKKVNKLNIQEARDMMDLLRKCDQTLSKKFRHVRERVEYLKKSNT